MKTNVIAAPLSSLEQVDGLKFEYLGFDQYDLLPFELPPFSVIRQEYEVAAKTLWVMNCGRFNTEKEAFRSLCMMTDFYRLEAGYTLKCLCVRPTLIELYSPENGDSMLLGIDSTITTDCCVN